ANLLAAYRRIVNLLSAEEKKDNKTYVFNTNQMQLSSEIFTDVELALVPVIADVQSEVHKFLQNEDYQLAMSQLSKLHLPVNAFLEKVLINDPNPIVRENRLRLLAGLRVPFYGIADFSLIEG